MRSQGIWCSLISTSESERLAGQPAEHKDQKHTLVKAPVTRKCSLGRSSDSQREPRGFGRLSSNSEQLPHVASGSIKAVATLCRW